MLKDDILRLLIKSKKGYVSGGELAERAGTSRTAIWKHIKSLEKDGYDIEAVPSKGYRLGSVPDILNAADIGHGLKTRIIGKRIELLRETGSTNAIALETARLGAPEGTVVIAETQTAGKGRLGRTWTSPRGNIYMSVILRPAIPPHKAPLITLMAAVAVASAVRMETGLQAGIKWPNDVLISGRKVAGLLTEMNAEFDRVRHVVLGIGLNVNMDVRELPPQIRNLSTTLAAEAGERINRTRLVQKVLAELERWYGLFLKDESSVLGEWKAINVTTGKRIAVKSISETFEGTAQGIDDEGRLVVKLDDGHIRTVAAGDVTILQ